MGWSDIVIEEVNKIKDTFPQFNISSIIINDGSDSDANHEFDHCKKHIDSIRVLQLDQNQGKGFACRHGVASLDAHFYIYTDIDFPFTSQSLHAIISLWEAEKIDVILGVRDQIYYDSIPGQRKIISRALRWSNQKILRLKTADTQTGLKGFSAQVKSVFLATTINRYLFDLEFIKKISHRSDLKIRTIVVKPKSTIQMKNLNAKTLGMQIVDYVKIILKP